MSELFYMQDSRSYTGDCLSFWGLGGSGYYTGLERCQQYTKEEAQRMNKNRETDIPLPVSYIEQHAFRSVDCQLMRDTDRQGMTPDTLVYVQHPGDWNGNDVYWYGADGRSVNLDKAKALTLQLAQETFGANESFVFWPAEHIDSIARHVVHRQSVNTKRALRGTGITLSKPKPLPKPSLRCEPCGRFLRIEDFYGGNCPNCGATNY